MRDFSFLVSFTRFADMFFFFFWISVCESSHYAEWPCVSSSKSLWIKNLRVVSHTCRILSLSIFFFFPFKWLPVIRHSKQSTLVIDPLLQIPSLLELFLVFFVCSLHLLIMCREKGRFIMAIHWNVYGEGKMLEHSTQIRIFLFTVLCFQSSLCYLLLGPLIAKQQKYGPYNRVSLSVSRNKKIKNYKV